MKLKLILLAVVLAIVSTASAQVGALRIPQQTGSRSGQRTERLIVPAANQLLGFDANKKLVPINRTSIAAPIGYAVGAGGAVTQLTSRTTGVTLSKYTGSIQTDTSSLAAETVAEFTVTNTLVEVGDVPILAIRSGTNGGSTKVYVSTVAAGSFKIKVANDNPAGGTAETGAIIINFVILKGAGS